MIDNRLDILTRFLEAEAATTRDRMIARSIKPLQRKVAGHFTAQGRLFLRGLQSLQAEIDANAVSEAVSESDWRPAWDMVERATFGAFVSDMDAAIFSALIMGGGQLFDMTNTDAGQLGIAWDLKNPRAVEYASEHAAAQVTKINDTTRSYLNSMITQATEEGWSYTKLSNAIGSRFTEFATGGDNPRSRRVAVYELGDAYEAGNEMAANELVKAGVKLQKKWSTAGDDKVRPSHRDSQGEGWQDLDYVFASGAERSPTDPGCRCTMLYRRKR